MGCGVDDVISINNKYGWRTLNNKISKFVFIVMWWYKGCCIKGRLSFFYIHHIFTRIQTQNHIYKIFIVVIEILILWMDKFNTQTTCIDVIGHWLIRIEIWIFYGDWNGEIYDLVFKGFDIIKFSYNIIEGIDQLF